MNVPQRKEPGRQQSPCSPAVELELPCPSAERRSSALASGDNLRMAPPLFSFGLHTSKLSLSNLLLSCSRFEPNSPLLTLSSPPAKLWWRFFLDDATAAETDARVSLTMMVNAGSRHEGPSCYIRPGAQQPFRRACWLDLSLRVCLL